MLSFRIGPFATCFLFIPALLSATVVEAQSVSNRVRLSADLTLFEFSKTDVTYNRSFLDDYTVKANRFSLLSQGLGLSLGGSVGGTVAIGARVFLGRDGITYEDEDGDTDGTTQLRWSFEPFLELMLRDGPAVPFILAGLTLDGTKFENEDGDELDKMYLGFRAGFGAHFFAGDSLSIDPRLEVGWANEIADQDEDVSSETRLRVGLFIALSGWFGESQEPVAQPRQSQGPPLQGGNGYVGRSAPPPSPSPAPSGNTPSPIIALDLHADVTVVFSGIAGRDPVSLRLRRRGAASVLTSCRQLVWQIDGEPMTTPVGHSLSRTTAGVLEALDGSITIESTSRLARAANVQLTACGATFQLTAAQRQQLEGFVRRMRPSEREPLENPWAPPPQTESDTSSETEPVQPSSPSPL